MVHTTPETDSRAMLSSWVTTIINYKLGTFGTNELLTSASIAGTFFFFLVSVLPPITPIIR
jgi:hypothetical protein